MTQDDLATDDVMILDTWDQVTLNSPFTSDSNKQNAPHFTVICTVKIRSEI